MPRRCDRRWIGPLAGLLVAVGLAGCAGVPTSGSVHLAGALPSNGHVRNGFRVIAAPPSLNLTPTGIVTGYIDALVDNEGDYATARKFLAPGTSWNSTTGTTLFDANSEVATLVGPHEVDVRITRVGVINPTGGYRVAPGRLKEHFTLTKVEGQWRISKLSPGVLLSTSDAQQSLQSATLYFFNAAQSRLVPAPIVVASDQPGLATTLVTRLLAGPPRDLGSGVGSAIPGGTALVGNVPTDNNGLAEVNLAGNVQQLSAAQLTHLCAEIVWTLRQVPGITAVEFLDDGAPLPVSSVPRIQPISSWAEFDPSPSPPVIGAIAAGKNQVIGINRKAPQALQGKAYLSPTTTADGATAAVLEATDTGLTLLTATAPAALTQRLSARFLSPPALDPAGDVLIARSTKRSSTLLELPVAGGAARPIAVPHSVRGELVSAISVSPDGSRVALVAGTANAQELLVGALSSRHGGLVISGLAVLVPSSADVLGVAWSGPDTLVTTVQKSSRLRVVRTMSVDGYRQRDLPSIGLPGDPTSVAAAVGQPVLVGVDGAIWSFSAGYWRRLSTGVDPSYPG